MSLSEEQLLKNGMSKYSFYENEPKLGDVVMVEVTGIEDNSVIVRLLEYQNREAMLPNTELSNVRIRSMAQTIKVGRIEPMEVLRVDPVQGYVDVSKKKVKKPDAKVCRDRYESAKQVHRILLRTAMLHGIDFVKLQKAVAFPAYKKFGQAVVLFNQAATNPSVLDSYLTEFDEKIKNTLVQQIQHAMRLKEVTVEAKVNATCYSSHGVDGLRTCLLKMQAFGEEVAPPMKLLVHLTACPEYLLQVKTDDKVTGRQKLTDAIALLKKELTAIGGEVTVKEEPTVIESAKGDKKSATTFTATAADDDDAEDEE